MSSSDIFTFLGGGTVSAVALALIAWARHKGGDQAAVAQRWSSSVTLSIELAENRAKQLADDLARMRATATETQDALDECRRDARELRNILDDTLHDLEQRGGDTTSYQDRAARLRAI